MKEFIKGIITAAKMVTPVTLFWIFIVPKLVTIPQTINNIVFGAILVWCFAILVSMKRGVR